MSHQGLAICIKNNLKAKEEYSNISPCKNIIFKKSSKRNQNPSRYYNSIITNLKFQRKPKYHLSYKNRPIITQGPKSHKLLYSTININRVSLPTKARPTYYLHRQIETKKNLNFKIFILRIRYLKEFSPSLTSIPCEFSTHVLSYFICFSENEMELKGQRISPLLSMSLWIIKLNV